MSRQPVEQQPAHLLWLLLVEEVSRALDAGDRRMISFHRNHGPVSIGILGVDPLPKELADCAGNVNTPDEWSADEAGGGYAGRGTARRVAGQGVRTTEGRALALVGTEANPFFVSERGRPGGWRR